jgi:hypothetical protein
VTDFVTMQTRIADELVRDDLSNQIKLAINDGIKQWEAERFRFNEKRYRILTVAQQEYYDVITPTLLTSAGAAVDTGETILEIDSMVRGGSRYPLTDRTQSWMDDQQSGNSYGPPTDYAFFANQLRFFPIPDAIYTVDISCMGRLGPNPLVDDGDTNAWMTEGEVIIRGQAKLILCRDVLKDKGGQADASELVVEAQWNLKRKMGAGAFTGSQKAWGG